MTNTINYQKIEKEASILPTVGFKKLHVDAILPAKAHDEDSGFDLYALEDTIIYPGQTVIVKTGIAVDLPEGFDATVRPRSGNTSKTKLRVQLGTVDRQYTGEIGVMVDNANPSYAPIVSVAHALGDLLSEKINGNSYETLQIREELLNSLENIFFSKELHTLKNIEKCDQSYPIGTYLVKKGDKIAQLVVHSYYDRGAVEVKKIAETERGGNGFGSTGTANE